MCVILHRAPVSDLAPSLAVNTHRTVEIHCWPRTSPVSAGPQSTMACSVVDRSEVSWGGLDGFEICLFGRCRDTAPGRREE